MDNQESICFYFPYQEDSGVPVLFARMANELAVSCPKIMIYVIDYENGVISRNILKRDNIILIPFNDNIEVSPPENTVLVMQTFLPYYWPKELKLKANTRLFFWNLHPQNLIPSLLPVPYLRQIPFNNFGVFKILTNFYTRLFKRLREYVILLMKTESLYFMDKSNLDYTSKYLSINLVKTDYIPVPVEFDANLNTRSEIKNQGELNVGWIGRLCDFKSYILVYTINKLVEIAPRFESIKFKYHIVGNGPFLEYIKKNINTSDFVEVIFHGAIPHNKLNDFLENEIDIVTAMGTSALEGAKLGKPTILLDFSFKEIKRDYLFRLLNETIEFDLAHLVSNSDFQDGNDSLYLIFENIINDYTQYSKLAINYFIQNHDIKNVSQLLVEKIKGASLEYHMINPSVLKKGRILQFYNKLRRLNN